MAQILFDFHKKHIIIFMYVSKREGEKNLKFKFQETVLIVGKRSIVIFIKRKFNITLLKLISTVQFQI